MYYYIKGILTFIQSDFAVLEAGGVGYKLHVTVSTISKISQNQGKEVMLFTYQNVKEDAIELYGFYDNTELSVFKRLISVSGVGPKAAMSVLGTLSADTFAQALANGDAKLIATAPGIGLKTAQKMVIELKDKLSKDLGVSELGVDQGNEPGLLSTVMDTLSLYGFSRQQIAFALKKVDVTRPLEEIIGETLKVLGKE